MEEQKLYILTLTDDEYIYFKIGISKNPLVRNTRYKKHDNVHLFVTKDFYPYDIAIKFEKELLKNNEEFKTKEGNEYFRVKKDKTFYTCVGLEDKYWENLTNIFNSKTIPENKLLDTEKARLNAQIDKKLLQIVKEKATSQKITLTDIITNAFLEYVE